MHTWSSDWKRVTFKAVLALVEYKLPICLVPLTTMACMPLPLPAHCTVLRVCGMQTLCHAHVYIASSCVISANSIGLCYGLNLSTPGLLLAAVAYYPKMCIFKLVEPLNTWHSMAIPKKQPTTTVAAACLPLLSHAG
jgi:hypothetical protein